MLLRGNTRRLDRHGTGGHDTQYCVRLWLWEPLGGESLPWLFPARVLHLILHSAIRTFIPPSRATGFAFCSEAIQAASSLIARLPPIIPVTLPCPSGQVPRCPAAQVHRPAIYRVHGHYSTGLHSSVQTFVV